MIFIEYVMLAGVNDGYAQAVKLAQSLDPKIYKINLIPFNPTDAIYEGSSRKAIEASRPRSKSTGCGLRPADPRQRHRRGLRAAGG